MPGLRAGAAVAAPALTAERERTFRALVEALGGSTRTLVDSRRAHSVTTDFSARFARGGRETRESYNALIDAVDDGSGERSFASLSVPDRLGVLSSRLLATERSGGGLAPACLVGEAIQVAAAPFYPPGATASVPAAVMKGAG